MLKLSQRNVASSQLQKSLSLAPKAKADVQAQVSESGHAPEPQDTLVSSRDSDTKASVWDTMSGVEKVGTSALGGWLGLAVVGTLLGLATPISGPIALGIGVAAGVGAAQAKQRLEKSELSKAEAAEQKEAKAAKPVIWKDSSITDKLAGLGVTGALGAAIIGGLAVAATAVAAPVALVAGAALGVAGGLTFMNVARNSDFEGWSSGSTDSQEAGVRMTTKGDLQFGLGGDLYVGTNGKFSVDYGGQLRGVGGEDQGRFLG